MLNKIVNFFTSLRLTVACLMLALVLVFVGTLAQVEIGLYTAQSNYFQSLFVYWTPKGSELRIPVWPGGYLIGGVLLVNLIAAHIKRFKFTRKKIGIFLTHVGLILLLIGQFLTEMFQVESFMRIPEGESRNYSENSRKNELAIIDVTDAKQDKVVAFPDSWFDHKNPGELRHPELPFSIRISKYLPNSWPNKGSSAAGELVGGTQGVGELLKFKPIPLATKMNDENKPAAAVEVLAEGRSLGSWAVSLWLSKNVYVDHITEIDPQIGRLAARPQTFTYRDRSYQIALRPIRYYKPYSMQLLDFSHDKYKGTTVAKNFSSRIRLENPGTGENREVLIYMNNPLRYGGETFYQGSFEFGDTTTILQVVRNPAWLTPYLSCTLVGLGLTVQFLMHLFGFARKSANRGLEKVPSQKTRLHNSDPEPEIAGSAKESGRRGLESKKRKTA